MKNTLLGAVAAAALLAAAPIAHAASDNTLSATDRAFLAKAAPGNQAEVDVGELVSNKAKNEAVKEFGRWMVSEHGGASRTLLTITQEMHGTAPSTTPTAEQRAMKTKLEGLSGDAFDRAYLEGMIADHKEDIADYEKEANSGQDRMIKTYAANMLPSLRAHLAEAQDLDRDLFNQSASGAGANARMQTGAAAQTTPDTPK